MVGYGEKGLVPVRRGPFEGWWVCEERMVTGGTSTEARKGGDWWF